MTSTPSDQRTATPLTTDGVESESFVSAPETQSPRPPAPASGQGRRGGQFPNHPIPHLQGPFEESIVEADEEGGDRWVVEVDAQGRRRDLLEKGGYERLCGRKWRQRPGERYHPFWKLISNMSFGVYLLARGLAKSEAEVLRILQSYVDELDEFIERSTEDFLIIHLDVRTRIQYLSLPLGNLDIFDEMLEDRSFRLAMIDYNEQIEHAIERFSHAIRDSINDIQKGKEAIGTLLYFLGQLDQGREGDSSSGNLDAICGAMLANIEGWNTAFGKLHKKGTSLDRALVKLGMAVVEMQRRVGVASRRSAVSIAKRPSAGGILDNERPVTVFEPDKPLPRDPDLRDAARGRPPTSRHKGQRTTAKSVPNLRSREEAKEAKTRKTTVKVGEGEKSKPQRSVSKPHLKPTQPKAGKKPEKETRPATAPTRPLKNRSISLEHLKTLCVPRRANQETMSKSSTSTPTSTSPPPQVTTPGSSTRRDNLKAQVLHYVKSDKVSEAWESAVSENDAKKKEKKGSSSGLLQKKTMDWPRSIFRAKSRRNGESGSGRGRGRGRDAARFTDKMTWLEEEPESLNTFSLKPKPFRDESPRLHVPADQQGLVESMAELDVDVDAGETGSLITALPSLPIPVQSGVDNGSME